MTATRPSPRHPNSRYPRKSATRRRITAMVAAYALLAQILLGALAAAVGPAQAAVDGSVLAQVAELCTPDGLVRVAYPDAGSGDPAPSRPVTAKCPFCIIGGHGLLPAPSGAWIPELPAESVAEDWQPVGCPVPSPLHITEVRPRGPPATA